MLSKLPAIALAEYRITAESYVRETRWYGNLIDFLNSEFPHRDGVWVNFEGPLESFLANLVEFEAKAYRSVDQITEAGAFWLGTTLVMSKLPWQGEISPEQHHEFCKIQKEFNEDNSQIYSLD